MGRIGRSPGIWEQRLEIERKFLVRGEPWLQADSSVGIRQGYLIAEGPNTVRVRLTPDAAYLTVKGPTRGISRREFEYGIPLPEAEGLLALCPGPLVEKTRYLVFEAADRFEVDVFSGANVGLVVAEIELEHEGQAFARPAWLGREVSHDPRYRNRELARHPYSEWSSEASD